MFTKARAQYLDAFAAGRLARSTRRFAYDVEEMMARGTREPSEKPDWAVRLDEAAIAEDSESEFLSLDLEDFHSQIATNLDYPTEEIAAIVEL